MSLTKETRTLLRTAFRPHAPIEDPGSFIGRAEELDRVKDALESPGLQVVVFGERGCGKTSLTNVGTANKQRLQIFCEEGSNFSGICKDIALSFQRDHPGSIRYNATTGELRTESVTLDVNNLSGNDLRAILPRDETLFIVLDELDRIRDKATVTRLAELVKNVSTYQTNLTFVFVGVSENADDLLVGHASNFRNLRQVSLGRMENNELRQILDRGAQILGLEFTEATKVRMVELSDRMPFYLHLLATESAKSALERGSNKVTPEDLRRGSAAAAEDSVLSLREAYEHAILSVKQSAIYRRSIWALAALAGTSHTVAEITTAVNEIAETEGQAAVTPQAVGQALKKLSTQEKGEILETRTMGIYRFHQPLMKGFVRVAREHSDS